MKIWFLNFLILIGFIAAYYSGFFKLIANKNFHIFSYSLVIIMFVIGFFIVGSPFNDKKKK